MVNGAPASNYQFLPAASSISYSWQYEQECARIYAGISIAEWDALPGNRDWVTHSGQRCKSDLLILYRMSNFIPAAAQDAQAREMKRKSDLQRMNRRR